ncbi:MAG TPA: hypothetical protein VFG86_07435, partial [Chloroflexota bacterium]|nr:hypothetical protein [Chloroflexota bacterium]
LVLATLTATAMYLLALRLTGGAAIESWLTGLLFAWSPMLLARGTAHFSLVAAAPLPIFVLLLMRAAERQRWRDAIALGATVAWAFSSDVYYAVYCLMIAVIYLTAQMIAIVKRNDQRRERKAIWALDILIVCVAGLIAAIAISKGWRFTFAGRVVSMRALYTPVLFLTVLSLARLGVKYRLGVWWPDAAHMRNVIRVGVAASVVTAVLLAPVLYALGQQILEDRFEVPVTFWRSSPPGLDVAAMVMPNPDHALVPRAFKTFIETRRNGYVENVGSLSLVALATMAVAFRRCRWRPSRGWTWLGVVFALMAAGPFIQVAGLNTHVPGPWALLRYIPLIGLARTPTRLWIVVMLALAALFALALRSLTAREGSRRATILAVVGLGLLFELVPAQRVLALATVPRIYQRIASDPRDVRVVGLPFGIRDGASSVGNFSALSQFYQTYHEKRLIGGYLSRVSKRRVAALRRFPVLDALLVLSEGRPLDHATRQLALERARRFVETASIGYVVIDTAQASSSLTDFAIEALDLEKIDEEGALRLYQPRRTP